MPNAYRWDYSIKKTDAVIVINRDINTKIVQIHLTLFWTGTTHHKTEHVRPIQKPNKQKQYNTK